MVKYSACQLAKQRKREELHISFTKWKEHLLRNLAATPPYIAVFIVMALCLVSTLAMVTEATQIVYVSDSAGQEKMLIAIEDDPAALMQRAGITPKEGDTVHTQAHQGNLLNVSIQRAFDVKVCVDGQKIPVHLTQGNVADALALAGVPLGAHDYTTPSLHTTLAAGDEITVHRVVYQDSVVYEAIPYETEYVYTSLYFRNTSRQTTLQAGSEGEKAITSRERWVDGVMESSQISGTEITREPVNDIFKVYGKGAPVSARTGPDGTTNKPTSYQTVHTGRCTGYSSSGGRGSSGLGLGYGTVAVNPNLIPYGTLLYIESTDGKLVYGYAIATDTGGALMNGTCLADLYFETYEESRLCWAQEMNVYVVG